MNIKASEQKSGVNSGPKVIGFFKGELKYVNPTAEELKEIYKSGEDIEEPKYQGKTKDDQDWAIVSFMFEDEVTKTPVPYRVFISKEVAEFEVKNGDQAGQTKTWYINQHGQSQCVTDKKDLFRSITHLQKWNKDEKKMEDVLDTDGQPIELSWRKAYKGETAIYSLLRKLVTQNWFEADADTSLFIKIDSLMRGNVKDITTWIGTENYRPVVGMIEISAKDGDNGINYYQNCVDQAWMPGGKINEANMTTSITDGWKKYDEKANGKGKNKEIYEFYQAVKRNKNITEFCYLKPFNPDGHIAAGTSTIKHSDSPEGEVSMDYDV